MAARPRTTAPTPPLTLVSGAVAAAYLNQCPKTVRNLGARGVLTVYRITGTRSVRYDMAEVVALAAPVATVGRVNSR